MPRHREIFDVTVTLLHETEKAILVTDGTTKAWLPKSLFEYEKQPDGTYIVTGPTDMLQDKGLI